MQIKETFKKHFGPNDHIWLFGSRADDTKRGGDIDLYIETEIDNIQKMIEKKMAFESALTMEMDEQKVDVVARTTKSELYPIHKEALKNGVKII